LVECSYAECQLCWMLQISPLCWVSYHWISLCWVSWYHSTGTIMLGFNHINKLLIHTFGLSLFVNFVKFVFEVCFLFNLPVKFCFNLFLCLFTKIVCFLSLFVFNFVRYVCLLLSLFVKLDCYVCLLSMFVKFVC
jgi:hypothetical protein